MRNINGRNDLPALPTDIAEDRVTDNLSVYSPVLQASSGARATSVREEGTAAQVSS